ncbi:hypothetical protein E2P65_04720 [Candidatus Bathyarchaeota archaeon]|nr:hypothetical protein E2P65_04720 [Candidatus Bathyarchaeota archaeon]
MDGRRRWALGLAAIAVVAAFSYYLLYAPRECTLRAESEHFRFYFDGFSLDGLQPIIDSLEENFDRIVADLGVGSMPVVRVKVWVSKAGFYREMERLLGVRYPGADGYVYGSGEFHVMFVDDVAVKAVHEFAHVVCLKLNPTFGNNPRWLWEAVALYEAGQLIYPDRLGYIVDGDYPSMEELDSPYGTQGNRIYSVGYTLAEYIVDVWGMGSLRDLVRTNGDLESVLGVGAREFELGWHAWVEDKYLS